MRLPHESTKPIEATRDHDIDKDADTPAMNPPDKHHADEKEASEEAGSEEGEEEESEE
ncbi:hypothetical protein BG000_001361, partial [Podila horticola]